ncbi:MAG: polyprenyl synthetase family protein [bacterium]
MPRLLDTPDELAPLQRVLVGALAGVAERIKEALASDMPAVQRLVEHVEQYHGKMIRPTLVILSGLACHPSEVGKGQTAGLAAPAPLSPLTPAHTTIGAVVEMVHLATLIHDDVLDEADERRQALTVNRLTGNEAAVMLGDYLFSSAYRLCGQLGDAHATVRIGQTGMTLCAGELLQLHNRGNFSLDQRTYFELIDRKTASLIAVSCELGARASSADAEVCARMARFGSKLGTAFQIQDDLLDLGGDQSLVGKSLGKDAEKGKLTLPVIHHLQSSTPQRRGKTLTMLSEGAPRTLLAEALRSTDSIEHSRRVAQGLVQEAQANLQCLRPSPARQMLHAMAEAVLTRAF